MLFGDCTTDTSADLKEEIDQEYADAYRRCYAIATQYFADQSALTSATATLFIQMMRDAPVMRNLTAQVQKKLKEISPEKFASVLTWINFHYAGAITNFPQLGQAIAHWYNALGVSRPAEMEARVQDYLARNGRGPDGLPDPEAETAEPSEKDAAFDHEPKEGVD